MSDNSPAQAENTAGAARSQALATMLFGILSAGILVGWVLYMDSREDRLGPSVWFALPLIPVICLGILAIVSFSGGWNKARWPLIVGTIVGALLGIGSTFVGVLLFLRAIYP